MGGSVEISGTGASTRWQIVTNAQVRWQMEEAAKVWGGVEIFCAGKSVQKQPIWGARLGNTEHCTLFAGAFHGMESITTALLLEFLQQLAQRVGNFRGADTICPYEAGTLLQKRGLMILPLVNPDGVMLANGSMDVNSRLGRKLERMSFSPGLWQANARGVDLNHNFDANWVDCRLAERQQHIFGPGPTKYGGRKPGSEPEVQALIRLCKNTAFDKVLAFHSQGEEIYAGHAGNVRPGDRMLGEQLAALSGYTLCDPTPESAHGGFKDWFCDVTGRPGCTIEVGKGINPLALTTLPELYARLEKMLYCAVIL